MAAMWLIIPVVLLVAQGIAMLVLQAIRSDVTKIDEQSTAVEDHSDELEALLDRMTGESGQFLGTHTH